MLKPVSCVFLLLLLVVNQSFARERGLRVLPATIELSSPRDSHGVLVSDEKHQDVTRLCRFISSNPSVFTVSSNGLCSPAGNGVADLLIVRGRTTNRVPVSVKKLGETVVPSFRSDVEPVLTRLGCNMGACHGKLAGQNGFKLSLRGYAPELDYEWLTTDVLGRRIDPAFPEQSLLLEKPSGKVPHEGGVRFSEDSRYYQVLKDWINSRAPAPLPIEKDRSPERIEILPGNRILEPGASQQLLVRAFWADGRVKDVTWLTQFFSNNETTAKVSADGLVEMQRAGETTIRAHFQGLVSVIRFTSPYKSKVEGFDFAGTRNAIDPFIFAKLKALHIPPSKPAGDLEFLRRAMLDAIGTLPTREEILAFDKDKRKDKRDRLVDSLFERPEFVDYWTLQLADLFQNRKERDHDVRGNKNVRAFHSWLRGEVAANRPWDQLVRNVLTAKGDSVSRPEIGYYIYLVGEKQPTESEVTDAVAQTFLGTRIGCARCHNHPLEKYTQDDFYHFAAFFGRLSLDRKATTELVTQSREEKERAKRLAEIEKKLQEAQTKLLQADEGDAAAAKEFAEKQREAAEAKRELEKAHVRPPHAMQPRTHREMDAQALDRSPINWAGVDDPRENLARWITATNNPAFSGVMINRLWQHFLGRGLVEPVDDLRASNPPSNPELWDFLSAEFVKSGYDLRHVMRLIMNSRTYQLSSETLSQNESDNQFFSHYYARRLPAEVISDAISHATGVPDTFEGFPVGLRAIQLPEPTVSSYFLTLFGRSERVTACACERNGEVTLPQLLHLQNGEELEKKIEDPSGWLNFVRSNSKNTEEAIDNLYLVAFGRHPSSEEVKQTTLALGSNDSQQRLRDLFWALLNAKEFCFNH